MQISLFGRTDKRPCIYTLMKLLQPLGDVIIITSNPSFKRLIEDGGNIGFYQNILICVTDATADEMWQVVEHKPEDFDHVILDGRYNEATDLTFYIQGAGVEAADEELFDTFSDMVVIHMGTGKNAVPYCKELMASIEHVEYYRELVPCSPAMTNIIANTLSSHLNLSAKDIVKVVNRK